MKSEKRKRLFVDMDGTLTVFTPVDEPEMLYEKGFFLNQKPHENVISAVKEIVSNYPEIEISILSAYLTDSKYALQEKNEWLDRYLPEIKAKNRIFVPYGSDKKAAVPEGVRIDDFLLDDYTENLRKWQPPARGIKLLNAINHTRGSWEHDRIRYDRSPKELAGAVVAVMHSKERVFDEKPDSKFVITSFEIKEQVFLANFLYNGKMHQSGVFEQRDDLYISFGRKSDGDYDKHSLTREERAAFDAYAAESKFIKFEDTEYNIIEKWENGKASYSIGRHHAGEYEFYIARGAGPTDLISSEHTYGFYTEKPTRVTVENRHMEHIAEMDLAYCSTNEDWGWGDF